MITPAHYEDSMKELLDTLNKAPVGYPVVDIKVKAIQDTVDVLNSYGYTTGAELFTNILMKMFG